MAPITNGAITYPGMIDFFGTPNVRNTAISFACDCISLCKLKNIVIPAIAAIIPVTYGYMLAAPSASARRISTENTPDLS